MVEKEAQATCSACGVDRESSLVCLACGELCECTGQDLFARLGLPPSPRIDLDLLEKRYLNLSRRLHPDIQTGKTDASQALALRNTSLLNEARATLTDDLQRMEYLLGQIDPDVLDRTKQLDVGFLTESLELSEEVEQAQAGGDRPALLAIAEQARKEMEGRLQSTMDLWDGSSEQAERMATQLHEAKVFKRIIRDAEAAS